LHLPDGVNVPKPNSRTARTHPIDPLCHFVKPIPGDLFSSGPNSNNGNHFDRVGKTHP
jgi:hypothetical protein